MKELTYYQFSQGRTETMRLVDVREPHEYVAVRVPDSESIPLSLLQRGTRVEDDGRELFLICRSGARSAHVAAVLESEGFSEITNISDGVNGAMLLGMDHVERG